ncbi:MAG: hypothetical protein KJ720_01435 [Proteobacteria bacterium]|nr:hypothetical protein [Pseudomonadota bacterium]MBU1451734.1 hypothetical protein [Pseudomonadota bacterium]MBU2469270.1 hypothetical protein [Pseudomonadota bacterium]MBU2517554.1 hypothetical protein [Pseudomonadota bacterium]
MFNNLEFNQFLRPSSLLRELSVLRGIETSGLVLPSDDASRSLSREMLEGYAARLGEAGWIEPDPERSGRVYRLTQDGKKRLRTLLVDYVQELISLHGSAYDIVRERLAHFYFKGLRKLAFYPLGETAEVVFRAMHDSGLSLVMAVDDDQTLWGGDFHGFSIQSPKSLTEGGFDGVLVTTCAFEQEITDNLKSLGLAEETILAL